MIGAHLKYLRYVLRHKWFVLVGCWRNAQAWRIYGEPASLWLSLIWRGIIHDFSKFRPSEWFPYVNFFYGPRPQPVRDETGYYKPTDTGDKAFDFAWLLHQKRNRHHWQWWVLPEDSGGVKVLEMPVLDTLEMLSDWYGAGRAQGTSSTLPWYAANKEKMQLHPVTREFVEVYLGCASDVGSPEVADA